MLFERAPDHVRSLLLDALVTYSDSCTLPNLTPSCPYFVQSEAGPTCREQCRDLIAQSGAADRRVRDVRIGGLVLHGRGMPQSVVSGSVAYDATKRFLTERRKSPSGQGTGSLLLGLKAALDGLSADAHETADRVMPLWAELERRPGRARRARCGCRHAPGDCRPAWDAGVDSCDDRRWTLGRWSESGLSGRTPEPG